MNETTYDTETLKAIIQEGRRLGYDDTFIACKLNIAVEKITFHLESETTAPASSRLLGYQINNGIGEGFRECELFHLPENDKRRLLIVIARVAEASYRRGLQQGCWAASTGQKFAVHPDKLRFGSHPLDSARMSLCGTKMTSLERLSIQHGFALTALGLDLYTEQ